VSRACLRGAAFDLAEAAADRGRIDVGIKRPMYCIFRRLASWLLMRFASSTAAADRQRAPLISIAFRGARPAPRQRLQLVHLAFLAGLADDFVLHALLSCAPMPKRPRFQLRPGELRSLAQVVLDRARHGGANGCDCDVSEATPHR